MSSRLNKKQIDIILEKNDSAKNTINFPSPKGAGTALGLIESGVQTHQNSKGEIRHQEMIVNQNTNPYQVSEFENSYQK
jgi:hypothetical protein